MISGPAAGEVFCWLIPPAAGDDRTLDDWLALLSADECRRAKRILSPEAGRRVARRRAYLRILLASVTAAQPDALCFEYGSQGKPRLAPSGPSFNLSASGDWIAVALTAGGALGIDIEEKRDLPDFGDIARRFFNPVEAAAIPSLPPDVRKDAFYTCWTRKEAMLKADGRGMTLGLRSLLVGHETLPGTGQPIRFEDRDYLLRDIGGAGNIAVAVAVEGGSFNLVRMPVPEF